MGRGAPRPIHGLTRSARAPSPQKTQAVRDDVRNMHVDMVRQVFALQQGLEASVGALAARQDALASQLAALQRGMEQLARGGDGGGGADELGGWLA
jgi:hypothetical protein